jgi:membrane-bound serine protease (ClpP class)
VISLFLGGLMLVDTVDPALKVSKSILITVSLLIGGSLMIAFFLVYKARMSKPFSGESALIGRSGKMHSEGYAYLEGSLWKVASTETLAVGDTVEVVAVDKLTLKVRKISS